MHIIVKQAKLIAETPIHVKAFPASRTAWLHPVIVGSLHVLHIIDPITVKSNPPQQHSGVI